MTYRIFSVLLAAWLCVASATPCWADDGVSARFATRDGEVVQGETIALDAHGLILRQGQAERRVEWRALFPSTVFTLRRQMMDQKDARQWLELGRLLRELPGGGEYSTSALEVAKLLDASLAPEVEAAMAVVPPPEPEASAMPASAAPINDLSPPLGPRPKDEAGAFTWDTPAALERAIQLEESRRFADEVEEKLGLSFTAVETEHFHYFTTVPPSQTYQSPRILDQMYDKACDLYGIPRGSVLFRGKCLIFMFASQEQFKAYCAAFGGHEWAAGFCQTSGDGTVRIVMFQGDDRAYTTQTMLHETAHGVNWRYRAPVALPPWLEEGIAEWIASNTTGNFRYVKAKRGIGIAHLAETRTLGPGLFGKPGISETWEYGIAYDMVDTLIRRDRARFVRFVDLIKDGQPWEVAMQTVYGVGGDEFLRRYGQSIGVPELRR